MTTTHNNTRVDLIYILDESGSMERMGKEPIQGVNDLVKEQQEALDDGATFTLYKFSNKVRCVYDDIPLNEVPVFTEKDYQPNNSTALLDAIGTAITTKRTKMNNMNVVVVIMTDGQENASKIFSRNQIKKMVSDAEKELHWQFIYLAANQDAFATGRTMGMSNCHGYSYTMEGYHDLSAQTSEAVTAYRTSTHTTGRTPQRVNLDPPRTAPARVQYPLRSAPVFNIPVTYDN